MILRQIGAEFETSFGRIIELALDSRKRWVELLIENPADKEIRAEIRMRGLWGTHVQVNGKSFVSVDGEVIAGMSLPALQTQRIMAKVIR